MKRKMLLSPDRHSGSSYWSRLMADRAQTTSSGIAFKPSVYVGGLIAELPLCSNSPLLFCWNSELYNNDDAKLNIGAD